MSKLKIPSNMINANISEIYVTYRLFKKQENG